MIQILTNYGLELNIIVIPSGKSAALVGSISFKKTNPTDLLLMQVLEHTHNKTKVKGKSFRSTNK